MRQERAAGAVLALACAAQLMVVLDVSVINVALPSIQAELGFTPESLQWVANGYLLTFGGFLLLGGRLADLHGRRRIFLAGLAAFSAASLAGGLATDPATLIAARAAQGLGAAVLAPATLSMVTTTFTEGPHRTKALATWTAVSVAGAAAGNLVGGILTEYLSWRATLLINVPIGALALVSAARVLAADPPRPARGTRLDLPGSILATTGLTCLTYGVTNVPLGWTAPLTLVPLAAGAAALALFAVVESRFASSPLVPPRLFRNRSIALGNAVMLLVGACFQAPMWYFLTLYMQDVLHYTALQTGLGFLPHTLVTIAVGWRLTPWLMRHTTGRTLIVVGALIAAAGFAWQSRIAADSGYLAGILGPALVLSFGGGLLNTPLTTTVTAGVGATDAGAVAGLMNTTKQIGGAFGLAALISISGTQAPQAPVDYATAFLASAGVLVAAGFAAAALPAHRDGHR
ncbi:MFS transporter [Saccharopolyspora sp. NPDC050389]|uniref:MFS transporter n=1 Tax=Saccharopolyspora sp. NPDC050389 TaxID=3155516 RepID=UPI0033E00FEA